MGAHLTTAQYLCRFCAASNLEGILTPHHTSPHTRTYSRTSTSTYRAHLKHDLYAYLFDVWRRCAAMNQAKSTTLDALWVHLTVMALEICPPASIWREPVCVCLSNCGRTSTCMWCDVRAAIRADSCGGSTC